MQLQVFRQRAFRNLKTPHLALGPGLTAIVGPNAAGKTNLLEALYLALGGELRGAAQERITFGAREAWLFAEARTELGRYALEVRLGPGGRSFWLNGAPASLKELAGLPGAVWLRPEDLFIVKGGPEERRRFLDALITRFSPRYRALLVAYERALRQRNAALKAGGRGEAPFAERLAAYGEEILAMRRRILARLVPLARAVHEELGGRALGLTLKETAPLGTLREALTRHLPEEVERGATLFGPHRDDLAITLDGHDAPRFASRGEARTVALALRLAEHQLLTQHHDEAPVLLLDDVVAELDPSRQATLLAYARGLPQAVVTGTEPPQGVKAVVELAAGTWEVRAPA